MKKIFSKKYVKLILIFIFLFCTPNIGAEKNVSVIKEEVKIIAEKLKYIQQKIEKIEKQEQKEQQIDCQIYIDLAIEISSLVAGILIFLKLSKHEIFPQVLPRFTIKIFKFILGAMKLDFINFIDNTAKGTTAIMAWLTIRKSLKLLLLHNKKETL